MNDHRLKMIFGFGLLLELGILAAIVGLGTVRMETSYGLNIILGSLATLSGGFAQWAFSNKGESPNETPRNSASVVSASGSGSNAPTG